MVWISLVFMNHLTRFTEPFFKALPRISCYMSAGMKALGLCLAVTLAPLGAVAEAAEICLAPIPQATFGTRSLANPTARKEPYQFSVNIGGSDFTQDIETVQCTKAADDGRVAVVITDHGQRKESFFIETDQHPVGACIWFRALYDTWIVTSLGQAGPCKV